MRRPQSSNEELVNSITHGVGALAGLGACAAMMSLTLGRGWLACLAVAVYGFCLTGLFLASSVYHRIERPGWKGRFQKVDHCAIYLLIAGTYTPFTVLALGGTLGWGLFATVWGLAAFGLTQELVFSPRRERLSIGLYLTMGWLVLVAAGPLVAAVPVASLALLVLGGVLYSGGIPFYVRDRPWDHAIWHGFVLAGAVSHAASVSVFLIG